jgi:site-specific recombinase XerD
LALRNQKPALLFIQSNGQAVSRQFFQTAINDALNLCGLNTKLYKAHSSRIGSSTEASHKGYFTETIRSLSRWKSDAYKLYLL